MPQRIEADAVVSSSISTDGQHGAALSLAALTAKPFLRPGSSIYGASVPDFPINTPTPTSVSMKTAPAVSSATWMR